MHEELRSPPATDYVDTPPALVSMETPRFPYNVSHNLESRLLPWEHSVCRSQCFVVCYSLMTVVIAPVWALVAIELSEALLLLFLFQIVIAIGALEWSWLAFRIRRRVLLALFIDGEQLQMANNSIDPPSIEGDDERDGGGDIEAQAVTCRSRRYMERLQEEMRARTFAIAPLTNKYCGGRWYIGALLIAVVGAGISIAISYWLEIEVFGSDAAYPDDWWLMLGVMIVGPLLSLFFSCLAPTPHDAIVLVMYQCCFLACCVQAYLAYYAPNSSITNFIDTFYILLMCAMLIIVFRIITSKVVMESLLVVGCDLLGLVCFIAPMIVFADMVITPGASDQRAKLALFLVTISATEIGQEAAKLCAYMPLSLQCHNGLVKNSSSRRNLQAFALSMACGIVVICLSPLFTADHSPGVVEIVVLLLAMSLGQLGKVWIPQVKHLAKVTSSAFYLGNVHQIGGVLDRIVVFLIAVVVYHPFIRHEYVNGT